MDLAMGLHDQLINMGIEVKEHEVKEVLKESDGTYSIEYTDGTFDYAKTVIYALGASHRKLNCEIEEGIPIHYCALCDGNLYNNKWVGVIGGGDVAFTQAEYLSKICKKVFIIMCDDNVTAAPSTFQRVKNIENIIITYNYPVNKISYKDIPSHYCISSINEDSVFCLDGIFVAIGMIPNTAPLKHSSVLLDRDGYIATDKTLESVNTPGFFAIGDVREKNVRQAITAAADGAQAVQSAICYLRSGGV
jgi:thioredoxin reductase (NADPH)